MTFEGDDFGTREFRREVLHQTATTVAMLTASAGGRENVMACEWAMMVATQPVRFIVSVGPHHVTHELIEQSGEFGLNFAADTQARLSHISGSFSLRDTDKWALGQFPTYPPTKILAPMIEGCTLNVECKVVETSKLGDHTLFLGEAIWAKWDPTRKPLIYRDGKYWYLGEQIPKE